MISLGEEVGVGRIDVCDGQRRHDGGTGRFDGAGRLVIKGGGVLEALNPGFEAAHDGGVVVRVDGDIGAAGPGLLDRRSHLADGELRIAQRVADRGDAAGGAHLDELGAALEG